VARLQSLSTFKIFAVDLRPVTKLTALVTRYGGFCCQNHGFRMSITNGRVSEFNWKIV